MYIPSCDLEKEIYNDIIDAMEWTTRPDGILLCNDMPIISNKKILTNLSYNNPEISDINRFMTFKPLKNNKHCQFVASAVYDDDMITEIIIKKDDDGKFGCKFIDMNNKVFIDIKRRRTETEALFCACYIYFVDASIFSKLREISQYEREYIKKIRAEEENEVK